MRYLLTSKEMAKCDRIAIEEYHISSIILMENAARSVIDIIYEALEYDDSIVPKILVLCGPGNNGGDGFAIARHLYRATPLIEILTFGDISKMSDETKTNLEICKALEFPIKSLDESSIAELRDEYDLIIDAMLGIGGSENLRGIVIDTLKKVNKLSGIKVAVDIPTGLNPDTGKAHPNCFRADHTITMHAEKIGLRRQDAIDFCGKISVAYISAPNRIASLESKNYTWESYDISYSFKERNRISSKFDYGRVLVIGGSETMPGAATLTANAAICSGAGLVELYSPLISPALLPEVIQKKIDFSRIKETREVISHGLKKANVIAIGPGLGTDSNAIDFVKWLLNEIDENVSVVIDADAIKALDKKSKLRKNIIITPHTGELSNLLGIERKEIESQAYEYALQTSKTMNCIVHLKYVPSLTSDGNLTYWTINGNPGMATAGSGDVLTGIIAALLAQEIKPLKAASMAAYIHAAAGDSYAKRNSMQTLTASKLIYELKNVM